MFAAGPPLDPAGWHSGDDPVFVRKVAALFAPVPVGAAMLRRFPAPDILFESERSAIMGAIPIRQRAFAAGRACARLALQQLGKDVVAIPMDQNRRPIWPADVQGAITHSDRIAAAVVCLAHHGALGLDVERIDRLDHTMEALICSPADRSLAAGLPPLERNRFRALCFSAKEAGYKCLSMLELDVSGYEFEAFSIHMLDRKRFHLISRCSSKIAVSLQGRYDWAAGHVMTGLSVNKALASVLMV